ncbi:hypothetical protein Kisp02_48680 [Kineosporia sp. NBRC 101731]|nr:hypothetical protein Kisp02_48680 [Kineosporia sp. NBRC 101731]
MSRLNCDDALLAGTGFAYDANGNETTAKSATGRTTTYGDRDQATSFTPTGAPKVDQTYAATGNGNRLTSGTTSFMASPFSPAPAWSKTGDTTTWTVRDPDDGFAAGAALGCTTGAIGGGILGVGAGAIPGCLSVGGTVGTHFAIAGVIIGGAKGLFS